MTAKGHTISGHVRQRSQPESQQQHHQQQQQQQSSQHQHHHQFVKHHRSQGGGGGRPASSFYEFEVAGRSVEQNGGTFTDNSGYQNNGTPTTAATTTTGTPNGYRKMSAPSPPNRPQWSNGNAYMGGSVRGTRGGLAGAGGSGGGPYVTQVQIQQQKQQHQQQHGLFYNMSPPQSATSSTSHHSMAGHRIKAPPASKV